MQKRDVVSAPTGRSAHRSSRTCRPHSQLQDEDGDDEEEEEDGDGNGFGFCVSLQI